MSVGTWTLQPVAILFVAAWWCYERGRIRLAARGELGQQRRAGREQAWLFRAGIVTGVVALVSPLYELGGEGLFAHALVVFALGWLVTPLVVLGAPFTMIRAGLERGRRDGPSHGASTVAGASRHWRVPGQPVTGVVVLLAAYWIWHVPAVLDTTMHSVGLQSGEWLSYLLGGLLFWSELVGSHPFEPRWTQLQRVVLIGVALAGTWILAAAMVYSQANWYAAYRDLHHHLLNPAISQQLAGAIMWAFPSIPLGVAIFWCFSGWLEDDRSDDWRIDGLLERASSSALARQEESRT